MLKKIAFTASLFIATLYIPLVFMVYFTPWYSLNASSEMVRYLGADTANFAHANLTQFFQHRADLDPKFWSKKETLHMHDVRKIYDVLFVISIGCISYLFMRKNVIVLKKSAGICIFLPLSLLLITPFFSYFWTNIFHITLFTNDLWIMNPSDLSYHLFPIDFFIKSMIGIVITSSILCAMIYHVLLTKDGSRIE